MTNLSFYTVAVTVSPSHRLTKGCSHVRPADRGETLREGVCKLFLRFLLRTRGNNGGRATEEEGGGAEERKLARTVTRGFTKNYIAWQRGIPCEVWPPPPPTRRFASLSPRISSTIGERCCPVWRLQRSFTIDIAAFARYRISRCSRSRSHVGFLRAPVSLYSSIKRDIKRRRRDF